VIRVLLADDQALVRAGFRALLDAEPDIEVVGEASDGREAIELTRALVPDIVLMDVRMPELDGLAATRSIAEDETLSSVHIVILTTFEQDEYVFEALRAGASGFLVKDTEPADLVRAVRTAHAGQSTLSPAVAARVIDQLAQAGRPRAIDQLTPREREVLRLLAVGLSNKRIALELGVAEKTVKTHVGHVLAKLELSDRTQAALYAVREGLAD
jgi:DNA-binding NarL/FixJ family response regulator